LNCLGCLRKKNLQQTNNDMNVRCELHKSQAYNTSIQEKWLSCSDCANGGNLSRYSMD
jgi:hypothetical protein